MYFVFAEYWFDIDVWVVKFELLRLVLKYEFAAPIYEIL